MDHVALNSTIGNILCRCHSALCLLKLLWKFISECKNLDEYY
jgi:hypothetical protein